MDMSVFVLLLLSGLLCSGSDVWRVYDYINQSMTWSEAQSYCRERFTDLATVDSMNDMNRMINTVNEGYSGSVWIGLKRSKQNRLGWSKGDDTLARYSPWESGYPKDGGVCFIFRDGIWRDFPCADSLHFVCYNEGTGYVVYTIYKTWTDAQSYCRQYHTDLATVSSPEEQNQILTAVGYGQWLWIGLFLDAWQWSDQWNLFFRNWVQGQHFQSFGDCVAMSMTDSGKWIQYSCDQQHPFICYGEDKLVKKQIIRLSFTHDGKYNLTDSSLHNAILKKIIEKLTAMGLGEYKSISWKKDEDGEVFHLSKQTVNSTNTCDKYLK